MENFEITSGPLPGSEKIYVTGSRSDIRVPMRKIKLSPTVDLDGSKIENEDVVVYDTSGPYTDTNYTVDLQKGLPKLRENWIEERQDTVKLEGLSSEYGRMRQEDKSLDSLRFEHVNTHPRIAREGAQVSQLYYARQGIITPEMEYIAIRENQLADRIREKYKKEKGESCSYSRLYHSRICPAGSGCRQGHYSGQHQSSGMRADDYRPELSGKNQCQYR